MADLNKCMMIGRLTRDPVTRYTPSNVAICDFGLASGRKYKTASGEEREETVFVDCSVWAKGAEIFQQYMKKGKQVFIEGRLKLDQWDDKTTGQKRSKLTVVVENFQFLGGKDDGDRGGQHESPSVQRQPAKRRVAGYERNRDSELPALPDETPPYTDEQHFKDDDIPFSDAAPHG